MTKESNNLINSLLLKKAAKISVEEVLDIINSKKDFMILDIRTQGEFNNGHIKGAILIPVWEINYILEEIPKDKPIITYCRSGGASNYVANILTKNGFSNVYDMGGILTWKKKGYPVVIEEKITNIEESSSDLLRV